MSLPMKDTNCVVEDLYTQIKLTIRQSFARLYAALKARELQTLRQFQAVHSHCESSHSHLLACLQSMQISYDVEPKIIETISQFGEVKLDDVNLEGHTFLVEDYVNPNEDHMYCYKDIEPVLDKSKHLDMDIEEAALRQITKTDNCVCSVNFTSEEIHKRFNDDDTPKKLIEIVSSEKVKNVENKVSKIMQGNDGDQKSDETVKTAESTPKTNPAYEWLNRIKTQTETEQSNEVMEHSRIKS